jgi:hypothetical protein
MNADLVTELLAQVALNLVEDCFERLHLFVDCIGIECVDSRKFLQRGRQQIAVRDLVIDVLDLDAFYTPDVTWHKELGR